MQTKTSSLASWTAAAVAAIGVLALMVVVRSRRPAVSAPPPARDEIQTFPEPRLRTASATSLSTLGSVHSKVMNGKSMGTRNALKALSISFNLGWIDQKTRSRLKRDILSPKPSSRIVRAVQELDMHGDAALFIKDIL